MKKIIISIVLLQLIFSSCKTSQLQSYQDDIYANPSEEKRLARLALEEKVKNEAFEKQKQEEALLTQRAKDNANPYYQDPQYNSDDYYDYKYASQIRRFNNPVNGAGYYNNYYTNAYMYNQNPSMYGSSIYNSYNWWTPSNQFNNCSNGLSLAFSSGNFNNYNNYYGGYNSFNPYCSNGMYGSNLGYYGGYNPYNSYGYNPYNNYGYNPYNNYMNGYNNGYSNGFNNGSNWGYFNSYDVNSLYSKAEYGARGSNGGSNSTRQTTAGMLVPAETSSRAMFIKEVAAMQENIQPFTEIPRRKIYNNSKSENIGNGTPISSESLNPVRGSTTYDNPTNTNINATPTTPAKQEGFWPKIFGCENVNPTSEPIKSINTDSPIRGNNSGGGKIKNSTIDLSPSDNLNNSNRMGNGGNSNGGSNSTGGGSSSPRSNGGGSSGRPR